MLSDSKELTILGLLPYSSDTNPHPLRTSIGQSRLLKRNQISWLRGERWGWPKAGLGDELVSMKSEHLAANIH